MTSKPDIPSPVIDVELLAQALDNLYERRWGSPDPPLPPGSTTIGGAYAHQIAAEYQRLVSESSIPVEEGSE